MQGLPVAIWISTVVSAFWLGSVLWHEEGCDAGREARPTELISALSDALADSNPLTRTLILANSLDKLTPENLEDVLAVIERQRVGISEAELRLLMLAWGRFDAPAGFAWSSQREGPWRSMLERAAIFAWGFHDPHEAASKVDQMSDTQREALRSRLVDGWTRNEDKPGLTDYVFGLPAGAERSSMLTMLLAELGREGPDAIRDWAEAVPIDAPRGAKLAAFLNAAAALAQRDPDRAAEMFEAHQSFEYSKPALAVITRRWVEYHDPKALFEWLIGLPPGEARDSGVESGFTQWWKQNPADARAWLRSTTRGPALDPAVAVIARQTSRSSAAKAAAWADGIHDELLRRQALTPILRMWSRENLRAARAWMNEHDVPNNVQREIIESAGLRSPRS